MEETKKAPKAKPTKAKVFKKNYFLHSFGTVGKGSPVLSHHKKSKDFNDSLTE